MGIRFQKRVKIVPGVSLNIGKRGVSVSTGTRGARLTVGTKKTTVSAGLPGTGLSVRSERAHARADGASRAAGAPDAPSADQEAWARVRRAMDEPEQEGSARHLWLAIAALVVLIGSAKLVSMF